MLFINLLLVILNERRYSAIASVIEKKHRFSESSIKHYYPCEYRLSVWRKRPAANNTTIVN